MKWDHVRKGVIEGELVLDDDGFLHIKLAKPVGHRGVGENLVVRKSFVKVIEDPDKP